MAQFSVADVDAARAFLLSRSIHPLLGKSADADATVVNLNPIFAVRSANAIFDGEAAPAISVRRGYGSLHRTWLSNSQA
jgi:hypothetical protein